MRYNAKYLKINYLSIGDTSDAGLKLSCSTNAKKIFSNYLEHYIDIYVIQQTSTNMRKLKPIFDLIYKKDGN
jgi:hypothetical protein